MDGMASDTRTRMLETTARLLQHRGYYGTALSDILEASGAPRGSLYFHFPGGKDQLVIEATRRRSEQTLALPARHAAPRRRGPAEGVRRVLRGARRRSSAETDYSFGCPVAPVILDAPDALPELEEICREAFEAWIGLFRAGFRGGAESRRSGRRTLALLVEASMEGLL